METMKTRMNVLFVLAVLCSFLAIGSMAEAAESVLDVIPGDALGFGVVNRLGATDAKIVRLIERMGISFEGTPLEAIKRAARASKGLDDKGSVAVMFMPGPKSDDMPKPAILVPVVDYNEFLENFDTEKLTDEIQRVELPNGQALVAHKNGHALLVQSGDQELLESILANETSIAKQVAPWAAWIDESDASAVLTGRAIKMLADTISKKIDEMKPMFETMGPQGEQAIAGFAMYQKAFALMGREVDMAGIGVVIEQDGSVRLTSLGRMDPDGTLADSFKDVPALPHNIWTGIPNEPFAFAAAGAMPKGLIEGLMEFSMNAMKGGPNIYQLDEARMKQMTEMSVEMMKGVQGMSLAMGVVEKGQPLYLKTTGAYWVDDSEAFLKRYVELINSMTQLTDEAKSPLANMTAVPVEIAGRNGLEVTIDLSAMYDQPELAQFAPLFQAMFGPEIAMKTYLVAADAKTIVLAYLDKDRAADAVKATGPSANLDASPAVAAMIRRLPTDAQWIGVWSPQGTIQLVQAMLAGFAPEGTDISLPDFPETPPVGFAMKASPDEVRKELLIPIEVIKAISAYLPQLQQTMMPQAVPTH
ncbi:MAG TPA: hypothetical protein DD670_15590 [Planctomycetaceae bacterium]|nr:hypothetical protein [Planctomycetaceae bacterium]